MFFYGGWVEMLEEISNKKNISLKYFARRFKARGHGHVPGLPPPSTGTKPYYIVLLFVYINHITIHILFSIV